MFSFTFPYAFHFVLGLTLFFFFHLWNFVEKTLYNIL